jgi:hypothetical protein
MVTALFAQCFQMYVVQLFCHRNVFLVPPLLCGFITANQQYGAAPGIKGIQHSIRPPRVLDAQLSQVAMPGASDIAAVGEAQTRPEKPQ